MYNDISICEIERIKAEIINEIEWEEEEEKRSHWCCWCLL